jgi:hypothetical protein
MFESQITQLAECGCLPKREQFSFAVNIKCKIQILLWSKSASWNLERIKVQTTTRWSWRLILRYLMIRLTENFSSIVCKQKHFSDDWLVWLHHQIRNGTQWSLVFNRRTEIVFQTNLLHLIKTGREFYKPYITRMFACAPCLRMCLVTIIVEQLCR